jgi:hypothetical protein
MRDYPSYAAIWVQAYIATLTTGDHMFAASWAAKAVREFKERESKGEFEQ